MALNTKYTLTFDVLETPAKVLATYVVYFKKEGYTGGITAFMDAEENGLRSKITNLNDSIIGINEKKIEIGILTAVDVSELQTTKPKEWKIEITKTVGTTITSDFEGWLIPTNNATDYEDGLKYVRLEATDGLNFLKNVDFVNDSSVYYDGVYSIFEILRLTLLKTGLSLKINTINNTFGVNDNKADTDEALKQRFVDIDLFRGDNEPFDSYKVLGNVVKTEKCRVYQEDGEWWIENIAEKETGFVKSRKYNADGSFVSGGTLNLGVEAIHNSNYQPLDGGGLSNTMPIKWAKVEHKLAKFKNRLMNKDFANFVDGSFTNWFKSDAGLNISRDGNGTSENLYGVKISGYATKTSVARSLYHSIDLAIGRTAALKAIERNITFSGKAYTRDVKSALVKLILIIETSNSGFGYFGLSDTGEWIRKTTDIGLDNVDINGYSKKAPVSWDIVSKKISDIIFYSSATGKMVDWIAQVTKVSVVVHLCEGIVQIDPFLGETQSSSVIYKNINLGWIDADTNRNLKQINYKATQVDYAPNNETYEAIYGDYIDSSNLSTIKDGSGNVTTSWVCASSNTPKNFHAHGVNDILNQLGKTPKVYDGTIWGLLKYRHSVGLSSVTNRGYIVSYGFNYGNTQCDVRVVEHANVLNKTVKKIGVLSDGTEIEMLFDSTPVTYSGNSTASSPSFFNFSSWIQQLLSGIKAVAPNDEVINVVWDNISTDDTHDFGAVVRRNDKLVVGDAYVQGIELGNKENQTLVDVLGGKIKVGYNLLYDKSIIDGDGDIVKQLGVDSDFQVDGRIEAVSGISVGSDGILITKELGAGGKAFGQVDAQNELRFVSPVVNVTNVLGVNQITGIGTNPITANAPIYFTQPIYVQPSNNPNSPITNAQFNTALAGGFAVSTTCKLLFNTNQSLAGAKTQGGYTTVTGDNILLNGQTTASENGVYVFDGTNFTRNTANDTSAEIRLKGHLILNGTFASTQWVNNNSTDITVGTTAITYTQWSGAELDPIFTSHAAFNVTNAKIATWDLASTYGTHIGLYVDLVSNQNIGGAKKFLTSIQSPSVRAGSDTLNISMFNYFGVSPRIASTASLDFFTQTNQGFSWTTVGDLTQMRLTPSGLCIGSFGPANYKLDVRGNAGFDGLISLGKTSDGIAMSSGTSGQFMRRSLVSNGFYNVNVNNWANIFVADISDIATYYQAKITATENYLVKKTATNFGDSQIFDNGTFLAVGGTAAIDSSKFSVIGKIGATTARIGDNTNGINIGNLAISSTGALGYNATSHSWSIATVEKLNLNASRLALTGNLNVTGDVDITGKFKLNGSFGADHTFLKSNGTTQEFSLMTVGEIADIDTYYTSKTFTAANYASKQDAVLYGTFEGERGFKLYHDATKLDTAALFFANQDTGIVGIHYFGLDNSNNVTQHGLHIDGDGFVYHKKINGSRARFLTTDDSLSGGGTSYSFAEPLYLNGNQVNVRVASASQTGVLTKEDWIRFNAGTGTGTVYTLAEPLYFIGNQINVKTASATQNGVLTKENWTTFNNKLFDGATINEELKFAFFKPLVFLASNGTDVIHRANSNTNLYHEQTVGNRLINVTGEFNIYSNKFLLNNREIDMSGFAIGKILKVTSATKAEWVTP